MTARKELEQLRRRLEAQGKVTAGRRQHEPIRSRAMPGKPPAIPPAARRELDQIAAIVAQIERLQSERDRRIVAATEKGASRSAVAAFAQVSRGRVQQIVDEMVSRRRGRVSKGGRSG